MAQSRWRSALLGSGAAVALLAAQVPASADEIEELRTQIEGLQDKMGKLEAAQRRKRRVAPAAAVEAGAKPRSWKLPGTNTSMQIGGYAKLDIIYDINANTGDSIGVAAIPAEGSAAANRQGHFRLHSRQSRFWIRTWTPTDWGELETHLQVDFFGAGGNELVSNSDTFRARHVYGRLGPVLAGQTWSTFMILEALPDVLDFSGPAGDPFIRQAQLRYTHSFGGGTVAVFAVENPQFGLPGALGAEAYSQIAATGAAATVGPDEMPDFVVGLTHTWGSGRASIRGLFRRLTVDNGNAGGANIDDSAFAWGIHAGFGWRFNNNRTAIGAAFHYGKGLGRYTTAAGNGTGAVLLGPANATASLETVTQYGGLAWIQHRWTNTLRSTVAYGRARNEYVNEVPGGKAGLPGIPTGSLTQDNWTVHANLIWSPVPGVNIGVEYVYAFNGIVNSANGELHRIQVSFQYAF